jgi:hypothetical protein
VARPRMGFEWTQCRRLGDRQRGSRGRLGAARGRYCGARRAASGITPPPAAAPAPCLLIPDASGRVTGGLAAATMAGAAHGPPGYCGRRAAAGLLLLETPEPPGRRRRRPRCRLAAAGLRDCPLWGLSPPPPPFPIFPRTRSDSDRAGPPLGPVWPAAAAPVPPGAMSPGPSGHRQESCGRRGCQAPDPEGSFKFRVAGVTDGAFMAWATAGLPSGGMAN